MDPTLNVQNPPLFSLFLSMRPVYIDRGRKMERGMGREGKRAGVPTGNKPELEILYDYLGRDPSEYHFYCEALKECD